MLGAVPTADGLRRQPATGTPLAFPVTPAPRVWVLTCHREGDNAQMIGLAESLGWPFEIKRVVHRKRPSLHAMLRSKSLGSVDRELTVGLEPPWPDLVIFAYHRNENVARWIRKRSGGRTRIVLVGRPWSSSVDDFDLIITTPQLLLPQRHNILHLSLPMHRVTPERLAQAAAAWAPRLQHLPRPYTAVLVGGNSGPYVLGRAAAERLAREACAFAREHGGGSLLVTTSARTPAHAAEAVLENIEGPAYCHRWTRGETENPYFGFLALADRIIVTGDSISMITEACATRKPVRLFGFGGGPVPMRPAQTEPLPRNLDEVRIRWREFRLRSWLYAAYMKLPRWRINRTRDLRLVHRAIVRSGQAAWLGEPSPAPVAAGPVPGDMARAVVRVRALLGTTTTATQVPAAAAVGAPAAAAA
jgi:mitochondrial fission protein ELM1